jgi:CBS domain-containing protein
MFAISPVVELLGGRMAQELTVRDVMMAPANTLPHDSSLLMAVIAMRRDGIRHLPVVDGQKLVGVLSERDVLRCAPSMLAPINQDEYNSLFENTPVTKVMHREPLTVSPDMPLRDALALMMENKLGCLPVVEAGGVVGILTRSDMLNLLQRLLPSGEQAASG